MVLQVGNLFTVEFTAKDLFQVGWFVFCTVLAKGSHRLGYPLVGAVRAIRGECSDILDVAVCMECCEDNNG